MTATKHDDTHATDPRPCSSFSAARNENTLSSSVLQCANQNVKSITLQAGGKSRQMKFSTVSGSWWMLVSPAGDTWRDGSNSSLTGEGIEEYVNTDSVFSLVLGLQLPVMIRRDRCQCEHAKQCPMEHLRLFYICCVVSHSKIQIILMESWEISSYARPYFKTLFLLHYTCIHNVCCTGFDIFRNHVNHYPANIVL